MEHKLLAITRRIKFYKQIYEYNFLPAKFAHLSWTENINLPTGLLSEDQILLYLSEQLIANLGISANYLDTTDSWLVLNSLSESNLRYLLDQIILTIIFSDNSSLIDGNKVKKIKQIFLNTQLKQVFNNKLKIFSSLNLEIGSSDKLEIYRFYLLSFIAQNSHEAIQQRYKLRFNKNMSNLIEHEDFNSWLKLDFQEITQVANFYLAKCQISLHKPN